MVSGKGKVSVVFVVFFSLVPWPRLRGGDGTQLEYSMQNDPSTPSHVGGSRYHH